MIKAVLFDLDDTLIDHDAAIKAAASELFDNVMPEKEHEYKKFVERWIFLNREWYQKFSRKEVTFQESGRGKLREAFLPYGCEFSNADADALLSDYWQAYVSKCRLFDDVNECLTQLQDYKVGVVTNGQEIQQVEKLRQCGILSDLDVVVTAECAGFAKPEPQIFQYACAKLGVQENESVYVGDNFELDAIAARDTGLVGVWLNRLYEDWQYSDSNVVSINQLTEISQILSKLAK